MHVHKNKKLFILLFALIFLGAYGLITSLTGLIIGYKVTKNPEIVRNITNILNKDSDPQLTSQEIMKIIVDENPELKSGQLSEFEIVNVLREWVFRNVPVVFYYSELRIENYKNVNSAINIPFEERFSIFRNGEAAAWCSATARTLSDVYNLFGFESYVIDSGDIMESDPQATHVITLVKINYSGRKILSVQDSYFNYSLVDINDRPMDYFEFIEYLKDRRVDLVYKKEGQDKLKPRLIALGEEEKLIPEKVFKNGNKLVLETFELPDFEISAKDFLLKNNFPDNLFYLHLFPFGAWGTNYEESQNILKKARVLTGTWCHSNKECWGKEN